MCQLSSQLIPELRLRNVKPSTAISSHLVSHVGNIVRQAIVGEKLQTDILVLLWRRGHYDEVETRSRLKLTCR